MLSDDKINAIFTGIMNKLGSSDSSIKQAGGQTGTPAQLTPSKILVITGLLGGVLEVTSVLIDKDQTVEILLTGSLKRKTDMDKMLDAIGSMTFDEVMKALFDHFS